MTGKGDTRKRNAIARSTLASRIADYVADEIRSGRMLPGSRILEGQLAEEMETSRGPVREALRHLAQAGLVEIRSHKGTFVADPSPGELVEMVIMRGLVEGMAARLVNRGADPVVLKRLDDAVAAMEVAARANDIEQLTALDWQFHEALCAGSGVRLLVNVWLELRDLTRLVISNANPVYGDTEFVIMRHREMLADLRMPDADLAELRFRNRIIEHGYTTLGLEVPDWATDPPAVGGSGRGAE